MGVVIDITRRKTAEIRIQEQMEEIQRLKDQLEQEIIYLREEIKLKSVHEEIIGRSQAMKQVLVQVEQVARTDTTVLILGETGTGKELLAQAIYRLSSRANMPLVKVNCASLPPTLIESELFGREKGAYTGALTRMIGRFEVADGATLFLDEIGEVPQEVQSKLLRVLEEGRFERLGSTSTKKVDVRVIAATNRNLATEVGEGKFRRDLYYRLNVFPIAVPPLRERPEDIPLLAWAFVKQFEKQMGKRIDHIPRKNMEALLKHPWPGNARELKNVIERAMIVSSGKTLAVSAPKGVSSRTAGGLTLEDVERRHIQDVLEKCGWRLSGPAGAARILGLKRTTLQSKMNKLGIWRPFA
jgi:transcriptional regulator with GAF, ATPase, and Fis domain